MDKVISTLSYTLGANLENLQLTGTSAINATGNTLNNTLTGNSGNNILNGLAGADIMSGGTGKDTFVFNTTLNSTTNKDTISDFRAIDDVINLENAIFTKLATTGVLNSTNFKASSTGIASDSNDYILYNSSNGNLSYDSDGNGSTSAILFATLSNKPADLTYADFVII
jgi:Ca2+-binding RTX toxin-like protein